MIKVISFLVLVGAATGIGVSEVKKNKSIFEKEIQKKQADFIAGSVVGYTAKEIENIGKYEEIERQRLEDKELGEFIFSLMKIVRAKMSPARKQIVARTVVRVANDVLETKEQKQNFAVLLSMENKFSNSGSSPAGAVGISQIMPQYAKEFAMICGITDYKKSDLKDLELNLYLGACQFRALLKAPLIKGNVAAALVGYNAGKHSKSFKELVGLRNIKVEETANYVARYTYINEEVKIALQRGDKFLIKDTKPKKKK